MNTILSHIEILRIITLITCIGIAISPLLTKSIKLDTTRKFIYPASILVILLCWRAPIILLNTEINVDEGQTLAQATCFRHDPAPWLSADTTTSGPLNTYVYMWPYLFGKNPDYVTLRLTSIMLTWGIIIALLKIATDLIGPKYSSISILPCIIYVIQSRGNDFTHASTEWLPSALTAFALLFGYKIWHRQTSWASCLGAGILLGAVPYAKLQGIPTAVVIGLGLCIVVRWKMQAKWKALLATLILGALAPTFFLFVYLICRNSFGEMWMRYIVQNFNYQGDFANLGYSQRLRLLLSSNNQMVIYAGWTLSILVASILIRFREIYSSKEKIFIATVLALLMLATLLAIVKTGYNFPHYLTLLILPLTLCALLALNEIKKLNELMIIPCVALGSVSGMIQGWVTPSEFSAYTAAVLSKPDFQDPLSKYISSQIKPGETLGMWGGTPKYFVETHTRSATRDIVSHFLLIDKPFKQHYRSVFLADLMKSKPKIFIDTATDITESPQFPPVERRRHTDFPELKEYIDSNYVKIGELTPSNRIFPFWIYSRK